MKKNPLPLLIAAILLCTVGSAAAADTDASDNWQIPVKERTPAFSNDGTWNDSIYTPLPKSEVSKSKQAKQPNLT